MATIKRVYATQVEISDFKEKYTEKRVSDTDRLVTSAVISNLKTRI